MGGIKELNGLIDGYEKEMVATLSQMVRLPAVSPVNGGKGEVKKAAYLKDLLERWGFKVKTYAYKDPTGSPRPNLIAKYGNAKRTLWLLSHLDVVAEGERALWKTDPFTPAIKDGKIFGRGTTDNGQSAVASIFALKALKELGIEPKYNVGIGLVADEEIGSAYGIAKLMNEGIFKASDMYVVPDVGAADGSEIEIVEKSALWLKVTIHGKQVHASTPEQGLNAFRCMVRYLAKVDELLHKKYKKKDSLFDPNVSTFEMTKHEKNVDSTNIIPGKEVFYIDSRILPQYEVDKVLGDIKRLSKGKEFKGARFEFEIIQREDATKPTKSSSEIARLLANTIRKQRRINPRFIGIGGGTVAAFFRRKGMPAVCWSTCDPVAHQPNEYAKIKDMVADAKVFAALFLK